MCLIIYRGDIIKCAEERCLKMLILLRGSSFYTDFFFFMFTNVVLIHSKHLQSAKAPDTARSHGSKRLYFSVNRSCWVQSFCLEVASFSAGCCKTSKSLSLNPPREYHCSRITSFSFLSFYRVIRSMFFPLPTLATTRQFPSPPAVIFHSPPFFVFGRIIALSSTRGFKQVCFACFVLQMRSALSSSINLFKEWH